MEKTSGKSRACGHRIEAAILIFFGMHIFREVKKIIRISGSVCPIFGLTFL